MIIPIYVVQIGPAYDTLSVRESFAHQRLRQMVEEERLNRYANTNHAIGNGLLGQIQAADSEQPQVYAQVNVLVEIEYILEYCGIVTCTTCLHNLAIFNSIKYAAHLYGIFRYLLEIFQFDN